jgi:CRP/FNR family transcriptional regulator, cyclic AMP receptor protein
MDVESAVPVLELDPDLSEALSVEDRLEATRAAMAATVRLEPGTWSPPAAAQAGHMGLLVLDGVLTRTVGLNDRQSVELLAPGDVLRPWVELGDDAPANLGVEWTVMEPATLAVLDAGFARRVARWPEIAAALTDRLVMRARWLGLDLAVCHLRRVDDRLMLLFWQLARRWGKVTTEGIVIPLALQHQLIAGLVGAQRPSVTTRLGLLRSRGLVERRPDGTWLLPGGSSIGERGANGFALADLDGGPLALEPS